MKGWVWVCSGLVAATVALGTGCAKRQVTRIDPDTTTDLSGDWNDTDSRLVAEEMIHSSLAEPWLVSHIREGGENPVVIAGSIKNRSAEHIEVRTFLKDIQRAFLSSGQVDIVADRGERGEVRDERLDQIEFADPETVKSLGKELGADFMLTGEINSLFDQEDGTKVKYYQVDLQLVDIETNKIVWLGDKKIKKGITRGKFKP
jgi:uncharacterized protein (TIGR02722 family)